MKLPNIFTTPGMRLFWRFAAVVLVAGVVDCLVLLFAKKPLPLAGIVAGCVPLFVMVFVVLPKSRAAKRMSKAERC